MISYYRTQKVEIILVSGNNPCHLCIQWSSLQVVVILADNDNSETPIKVILETYNLPEMLMVLYAQMCSFMAKYANLDFSDILRSMSTI